MKRISIIFASLFLLIGLGSRGQAQCPDGSDCYIVITGQAAWGGGWYGCTLDLAQNDSTVGSFTFTDGSVYTDTIRICTANGAVSLIWNEGNYSYQASFSVYDSVGNTLYTCDDGSILTSGVFALVDPCPTCPGVVIHALKPTSSSVTFTWTELGSASNWYYSINTSPTPGTWIATSDTSVSVNGLNANTIYYFFVYSDCGAGDTSLPSFIEVRTDCNTAVLPYSEGFESYNSSTQIPFCWTPWETITYWSYIYPSVDTWYAGHSGSNCLYFEPNNGTQSLIGPKMPVAANQVEMFMWVNGEAFVQVGYVTTNDTANAVFHHVGTVGGTTEYQQFHVSFDTVTTTDSIWVAFRSPQIVEYWNARIDDLLIRQINNCPSTSTPVVTGTADSSVSLSWTCASGSQWQIAYGPQGFDPETTTSFATSNTTMATITGLDNDIIYDFYVRTVCGSQYGYWSNGVTALPNMYAVATGNDTVVSCNRTIVDDGGLFFHATPALEQSIVLLPSGTDQTVRIQGYAHMYSDYVFYYPNIMRIFAGTDTTGRLLAAINSTDVDNIDITSEVGAMTLWISYAEYDLYAAEGFRFQVSCVDRPDCTTPYGLTVDDITGHSASVNWVYDTTLGQANGFTITVTDVNADVEVENHNFGGNERSAIVNGLSGRTYYRIDLILDCYGIDTIHSYFTTGCDVGGEVQIGTGSEANTYLPIGLNFSSSISQQLYLNSELNGDTAIHGFRVFVDGTMSPENRQWNIYLDTTSAISFNSTSDYSAPSVANRYFNGTVLVTSGWVEVIFDRPFIVPDGMNILLTVNDVTGSASYNYNGFLCTSTGPARMALYGYDYYDVIDATSPYALSSLYEIYRDAVYCHNTIVFLTPCNLTTCIPPTFISSETTSTTATISWEPGNDETEWMVQYQIVNDTSWTTENAATADTVYVVTGLIPATDYTIRVLSLCGDEASPRSINVTTQCGAMPLPFSEGFENFTAEQYEPNLQRCWDRYAESPYSGYYYPHLETSYGSFIAGYMSSKSLKFTSYNSTIILPEMAVSVDSLNLAFFATTMYDYYGDVTLEIGVCTDPADLSSYSAVTTRLVPVPVQSQSWHFVEVDLDGYSGIDGRIYIRNISDGEVYIDSILVSQLPDCRRVSNVQADVSVPGEALVTFSDRQAYNNYIFYYSTQNDINTADSLFTSSDTVLLTGLPNFTLYYVWIRSVCSDSTISDPSPAAFFRTSCAVFEVTTENSYFEEFESGLLDCITQEGTEDLHWENVVSSYDAAAISGGHMAWIGSYSPTAEALLILPEMSFSTLSDDAELSFYRFHYQDPHPTAYYPADPAGILSVYYRTAPSAEWTLIATVDSTVNTWQKFHFSLPTSAGASSYQVAIKGQPMGNSIGIFIDNVVVMAHADCMKPSNISVHNITDRTATVTWLGNSPSYRVEYRAANTLTWLSRIVTGVDSVILSPLDMTTPYQVRIIGLCPDGTQSETSDVATFTTLICANHIERNNWSGNAPSGTTKMAPLPAQYFCSYAEIIIDSAVLAGMQEVTSIDFYVNYKGDSPTLGPCQIYMGHTNASSLSSFLFDSSFVLVYNGIITIADTGANRLLLSSPFPWDGHSNVIVGFQCYSSNYSNYYYNYDSVTYATHQATSNKLFYGNTGSVWNSFTPDNANLISDANKGASNMVPDLTLLGCLPVCHEPVLHYLNADASNITVDWYNENAVVQIQIKPSGSDSWGDTVFVNTLNNNIHSHTFYNLLSSTSYDIRFRRDCTSDGITYSDWVEVSATTGISCSVPTGLTVTNIDANSATFAWSDGPTAGNRWELLVWNSNESIHYDVASNPTTINGLTAGMNYQAKVRAYCGNGNEVVGDWSSPVAFDNICHPVTDLQASIVGCDATLTWNAHPRHQQWLVIYGYAGFNPNEMIGYRIVSTNSTTITGLDNYANGIDNLLFGFRVRPLCSDLWSGDWSDEAIAALVDINPVETGETTVILMPNPASDRVSIAIPNLHGSALITILTIDGRQISHFETTNASFSFDLSAFHSGAYYVRIQTSQWSTVRKLIVK